MSMVKEITNMILDVFGDDHMHTVKEIQEAAIERKIISPENTSAVRNALFKIKNHPRVELIGRGQYIIHSDHPSHVEKEPTVDRMFARLNKRLKEIKELDVINNTREELEEGKREVEIYKRYMREFSKMLNS